MTETEKTKIESWTVQSWNENRFLHFNNLHINIVNRDWADPVMWLDAGAECLGELHRILVRTQIPLWSAVGFSLQSSGTPVGVNFFSRSDLIKQFGETPPSLYLFQPIQEAWLDTPKESLHATFLLNVGPDISWFYSEYLDESDPDYRRVLWAAVRPFREE